MRRSSNDHAATAALLSTLVAGLLAGLGAGCDPYGSYGDGDEALGPVDPVNFPPGSVGTGGDRKRPGRGVFAERAAFAGNEAIGYFNFSSLATGVRDPLRLREDGKAAQLPTPGAYSFDATDAQPIPEQFPCAAPPDYVFDQRRDEVPFNQQGNIFSTLPGATYGEGTAPASAYVPVVAETRLSSSGLPCQKLKSVEQLAAQMVPRPEPSGKYLAWLVIDPGAAVYPKEDPTGTVTKHGGVGLQRWGWYKRFLLAYLDGGYIPTTPEMEVTEGTAEMPVVHRVVRMVTQRLLIPRSLLLTAGAMPTAGAAGAGYDVLEARRGQPGYSPVCEVWTYDSAPDPASPPLERSALPHDAAEIMTRFGGTLMLAPAANRYVYCLQVR